MTKQIFSKSISLFITLSCLCSCQASPLPETNPLVTTNTNNQINMKLTSANFLNNGAIPVKNSCYGVGISPVLEIADVPSDAVSLALILDDPDAPSGNFNHWVMWNIPTDTKTIPENVAHDFAVQGNNGAGKQGFTAPCPPSGIHRYFFKLYALNQMLDLPATANKADLEKALAGKTIDEIQLMGTYKKTN